jgi:hypothetical protein
MSTPSSAAMRTALAPDRPVTDSWDRTAVAAGLFGVAVATVWLALLSARTPSGAEAQPSIAARLSAAEREIVVMERRNAEMREETRGLLAEVARLGGPVGQQVAPGRALVTPARVIALAAGAPPLTLDREASTVLSLPAGADRGARYRIELFDGKDRRVAVLSALPAAEQRVAVAIPAGELAAGHYRLELTVSDPSSSAPTSWKLEVR